jgi:hypothetical protein
VPRKKRTPSRSAGRIHGGGIRDDRYLLDEFTTQDLRRWKHNSNLLNEYRVRQFYELESQFGPALGQRLGRLAGRRQKGRYRGRPAGSV